MFGNEEAKSRGRHPTVWGVTEYTDTSASHVIEARYDGMCDYCGEEIFIGDELIKDDQTEQWIHAIHGE